MADVQDLFVERVDGDRYLFEDEWRPLEIEREEIVGQGRAGAGRAGGPRHPPRADRQRGARRRRRRAARAALAGARRSRPPSPGMFELLEVDSGPGAGRQLEGHTSPASNLIWADRHGSIGYKLIGRLPLRRGGCPDLPKPGWTGEFEWDGTVPYDGAAGGRRPRVRLPDHRQQPHRRRRLPAPHHQRMARRLPRQADRAAAGRDRRTRPRGLRGDADRRPLAAGPRGGPAARPPAPRAASASAARSSACAAGTAGSTAETIAGTIYQAFILRLAREVARAAIGDRDLCERWLDRADNGFTPHVTSPWRWHSHLMCALGGGRRELIGRPWDELVLEALARRPRRPRRRASAPTRRAGAGATCTRWSSRTRSAKPTRCCAACSTAASAPAAPRRRSARSPTTPTTPTRRSGRRAGGWSPTRPTPSARAGRCSPASPATPPAPTTTTCSRDWLEGRTQPMCGEGPWQELELVPGQ